MKNLNEKQAFLLDKDYFGHKQFVLYNEDLKTKQEPI